MENETSCSQYKETHEQFVQRVGQVFPAERARSWSRIERAVFNHLLGRLISRHSYETISDSMLDECREDMDDIVRRFNPS